MKIARFVLKIVALSLTVAAGVCCAIAYWDRIAAFFGEKLRGRGARGHPEYDDTADGDACAPPPLPQRESGDFSGKEEGHAQ